MADVVVPALDPDTLEPITENPEQVEAEGAETLAESFGGEQSYRDGVVESMRVEGGLL